MSDDLIKRSDAIKAVERLSENYTGKGKRDYHPHIDFIVDELKYEVPSADVVEPKRGEWIKHEAKSEITGLGIDFYPTEYECSSCGLKQSMYFINSEPSNFCPNCGADMRKESE